MAELTRYFRQLFGRTRLETHDHQVRTAKLTDHTAKIKRKCRNKSNLVRFCKHCMEPASVSVENWTNNFVMNKRGSSEFDFNTRKYHLEIILILSYSADIGFVWLEDMPEVTLLDSTDVWWNYDKICLPQYQSNSWLEYVGDRIDEIINTKN